MRTLWWSSMLLVAASGCAQTATYRQLEPARIDLSGQTVAVLHLEHEREEAAEATSQFVEMLRSAGACAVIDRRQLSDAAMSPLFFANGSVNQLTTTDAARRAGAQVLLLGKIRFFENDGSPYGTVKMRLGDPAVAAICQYRLIDLRTGQLMHTGRVQSEFLEGSYSRYDSDPDSETKLLQRSTRECVQKLVSEVAPHLSDVQLSLAHRWFGKGAGSIRAGNQAAGEGDWDSALRYYETAIQEAPESDDAWYNLGLALEATGRYPDALAVMQRAIALQEDERYLEAVARIEATQPQVELAYRQKMQIRY